MAAEAWPWRHGDAARIPGCRRLRDDMQGAVSGKGGLCLRMERLEVLLLLALKYFALERRGRMVRNSVAGPVLAKPHGGRHAGQVRFAHLEDIHLQGDVSENGLNNAWGCMVNYQYEIKHIERNHEAYVNNDEIIASSKVMAFLKSR